MRITPGGVPLNVHKDLAVIFDRFITRIIERGYPIVGKVLDDWGWNHRYIAGTKTLSNHSWGLAVDLNALTNPMTSDWVVHTDMPAWVIGEAHAVGLDWGGHYTGKKKDPMHFEFLGTPAEARAITERLLAPPPADPNKEKTTMETERIKGLPALPNGRYLLIEVTPEGRVSFLNDLSQLGGKPSAWHKGDLANKPLNAPITGYEVLYNGEGKYYGYALYAAGDGGCFVFS